MFFTLNIREWVSLAKVVKSESAKTCQGYLALSKSFATSWLVLLTPLYK